MGSVTARKCEGCRRALPEWWDNPRCPGCPAPLQAGAPDTVAGSPLFGPEESTWAPPGTPPAAPVGPAPSGSRRTGGWLTVAAALLGRRMAWRLAGAAVGVTVLAAGAVAARIERSDATSSPARSVLQGPCAEYRELSGRTDEAMVADYLAWLAANQVTFDQAAALDPDVADAATAVHALRAYHTSRRVDGVARLPRDQLHALAAPLVAACRTGPGRA